jgi:hypothetical protein
MHSISLKLLTHLPNKERSMFTEDEQKLLKLNLTGFPLMAAASAAIKGCSTCPHNRVDKRTILRAAAIRL